MRAIYDIAVDEVAGHGDLAYLRGHADLAFTYVSRSRLARGRGAP